MARSLRSKALAWASCAPKSGAAAVDGAGVVAAGATAGAAGEGEGEGSAAGFGGATGPAAGTSGVGAGRGAGATSAGFLSPPRIANHAPPPPSTATAAAIAIKRPVLPCGAVACATDGGRAATAGAGAGTGVLSKASMPPAADAEAGVWVSIAGKVGVGKGVATDAEASTLPGDLRPGETRVDSSSAAVGTFSPGSDGVVSASLPAALKRWASATP